MDAQVKDVKDLILSAHKPALRAASDKKFLFDIVANGINGIDVDKCASHYVCITIDYRQPVYMASSMVVLEEAVC
jgi:hypothetical protein